MHISLFSIFWLYACSTQEEMHDSLAQFRKWNAVYSLEILIKGREL